MISLYIPKLFLKKNYFFFFVIIKKKIQANQKNKTKGKSAKLRSTAIKKFNDELLNLKIILDKMEKLNAIWH